MSTTVQLQFTRKLGQQSNFIVEDAHTHSACTALLLQHGIHTTQSDHCTIEFETQQQALLGLMFLSGSDLYTARLLT